MMKTTYQKDDRLPQHTAVGNDDTPITYPTSPHEWLPVKAVEEKDGRIAELEVALRPFAAVYDSWMEYEKELEMFGGNISLGDIVPKHIEPYEAAAKALEKPQ